MPANTPIKTILVALALEGDSTRVADRAVQLANQHDARLIAVHVIENPPHQDALLPASANGASLLKRIENEAKEQLQSLLSQATKPAMLYGCKSYLAIQP